MKYEVNVNRLENVKEDSNVRGYASVVFGGGLKVCNIAILENREGTLFVSMPRYATSKEEGYKDICNPITKEFRAELYDAILETYEDLTPGGHTKVEAVYGEDEPMKFNVKVTPFKRENSNIRGLCRIYVEDCFVISNVSLLAGKNGIFVAMPSYKTKQKGEDGKNVYQDIVYPVTKESREKIYGAILEGYEKEKNKGVGEKSVKDNGNQSHTLSGKEEKITQSEDLPFR